MKHFYAVIIALLFSSTVLSQDIKQGVRQENNPDDIERGDALQVKPEYPGGIKEFYKFVSKNFRTPEVDESMTAKILVSFVVEKDGTLSSIKVIKDPGFGMGAEAVRVLKSCTAKWTPGMQDGKPVRASYMLPITLVLEADDVKEEEPTTKE
ncbi:MAG: energy transducer TonB [Bacteroidota bacterium]